MKAKYDDSNLLAKLPRHFVTCEKLAEAEREMMLRQKLAYDCRSGKRIHVRRTALVAHFCRANRWFLITDF